jgi:Cdc6-like AAA superfamily ATPase
VKSQGKDSECILIVSNSAILSQEDRLRMRPEERLGFKARINQAFSPSAPINSSDLFAGRSKQIDRVVQAVFQRGQHAIIFGERGVGKTSLANIIYDLLILAGKSEFQVAKHTCGADVTFAGIWRTIFKQLTITRQGTDQLTMEELLPEDIGSDDIRETFQSADAPSVIIIDEVDRIAATETAILLADTIKSLSDNSVNTTLVLVGVADSVDQLIAEHQSIERALVQIHMPRMSGTELVEIVDKGLAIAQMSIESDIKTGIANLSQGLPPCTHLLARHAAIVAVDNDRTHIIQSDLAQAVIDAVANQQQSIVNAYEKATHSPRENLYKQVLLACALAKTNELGYFSAVDVREPMRSITHKDYDIPAFSQHLNDFCEGSRGPILQKIGERRRFRFRFINPLIEQFVVLKGISDGMITRDQTSLKTISS